VRRLRKRPRKSAVAFADQALTPSQSKRKTAPHTKATKGSAFFDSIDPIRTLARQRLREQDLHNCEALVRERRACRMPNGSSRRASLR
jgi:hypothetical protein